MVGTIRYLSEDTGELVIFTSLSRMYCKHCQEVLEIEASENPKECNALNQVTPSKSLVLRAFGPLHAATAVVQRTAASGSPAGDNPNNGICWSFPQHGVNWPAHLFANYESENFARRCMFFLFFSRNDTLKSGTQLTRLFCTGRWLTSFCCTAVLTTGIESVKPLQDKSTSMQLAGAFPGVQSVQGIV